MTLVLQLLFAGVTGAVVLHDVALQHAEALLRLTEDLGQLPAGATLRDHRLALGYVVLLPWQIELERNRTSSGTLVTDVSISESLHALCWSLPRGLLSPLSLQCNALNNALTTATLRWIRADDGADEAAARLEFDRSRLALHSALLEFLNLYRWPHACRNSNTDSGGGVASLAWHEFDALMDGESDCMSLTAGNDSAALDAPFIVILHRGDNNCAPSAAIASMLRRSVARRFPTLHFFELYARSSYWSLVSSLSIKVAMSPSDSDVVRVLRQFTATPTLVLLQCRRAKPGAAMQARLVSTFGRTSTSSFYISQWLAWRTGLAPQLEVNLKDGTARAEADVQQYDLLPSEEFVFVLAATFLFASTAWRFANEPNR